MAGVTLNVDNFHPNIFVFVLFHAFIKILLRNLAGLKKEHVFFENRSVAVV